MAEPTNPTPTTNTTTPEKTFRSFTDQQGANYARYRRSYHPNFYKLIIDHHTSTGGHLDALVDVGCGPGLATRDLAPFFTQAYGFDASPGMINTARTLGGTTSTSQPIHFEVTTAESLGQNLTPPIPDSSIDLITAATAAHWFDMAGFWARAAQLLKPGGTVAIWGSSRMHAHHTVPNREAIEAAILRCETEHLKPYMLPGSFIARNLYRDLPLPWTLDIPVPDFDEVSFVRKEWNADGSGDEQVEEFFNVHEAVDLDRAEKMLGTGSAVVRWREANPDKVGTEQDVVRLMRREIERLLHEAGVEKGEEKIKGGIAAVLLLVKKKG